MYNLEVTTGRIARRELVPIKISTAFNKQQGGYFHHIWPGTARRKYSVIENDNQLKLSLMVNCQEFHGTTLVWFHILWEIDPFVPGIVWSSSQLAPPIWDVKQSIPCIAMRSVGPVYLRQACKPGHAFGMNPEPSNQLSCSLERLQCFGEKKNILIIQHRMSNIVTITPKQRHNQAKSFEIIKCHYCTGGE